MPRNVYNPIMQGFVQTQYVDQIGTAYPGQLYSVSDNTLVDSAGAWNAAVDADTTGTVVDNGFQPGRAYAYEVSQDPSRTGIDQFNITDTTLAAANITAYTFAIVVRNEQMHSNAAGQPCAFHKDLVNILRPTHFGRIWVELDPATPGLTIAVGDPVSILPANGTFSNTGGVAWANAKFISENKNGIAAIEFHV